jgi:hypothetical protein
MKRSRFEVFIVSLWRHQTRQFLNLLVCMRRCGSLISRRIRSSLACPALQTVRANFFFHCLTFERFEMIQFIAGKLASGYEFAPRIQRVYVPLPL